METRAARRESEKVVVDCSRKGGREKRVKGK